MSMRRIRRRRRMGTAWVTTTAGTRVTGSCRRNSGRDRGAPEIGHCGALLPGELKRGKGIHGREEKQRRPRQGTTRWWLLLGSSEDEGSRGDHGAFGIGWRRKIRRKGIWEDPEVGDECGGGREKSPRI